MIHYRQAAEKAGDISGDQTHADYDASFSTIRPVCQPAGTAADAGDARFAAADRADDSRSDT